MSESAYQAWKTKGARALNALLESREEAQRRFDAAKAELASIDDSISRFSTALDRLDQGKPLPAEGEP